MTELERKAAKYDLLMNMIQKSYDRKLRNDLFEDPLLIFVSLTAQRKGIRSIKCELNWQDHSDEPLGLDVVLDKLIT